MEKDKDVKQDARNDRLTTLRKTNEEVLRMKLRMEAKKKCESYFRSFGDCAKTNGFMVVFNCRKENNAMSSCMETHYNENEFRKFLKSEGISGDAISKRSWT
mmetsp:Transcript_2599/g.4013  ORF Transcript_2599/g.4013 Transcript_2599/m.4013 type:complete len:102 (+) Transcript_2599:26-331(+)